MDSALRRIDEHDFGSAMPEGQPWRKERAAKRKGALKKQRMHRAKRMRDAERNVANDTDASKKRKRKGKERLPIDESEAEEEEREPEIYEGKTRKIRIFPTAKQKTLIKRWIGTARWTYNQCNAAVKRGECVPKPEALRGRFVTKAGLAEESRILKKAKHDSSSAQEATLDLSWVLDTPADVRDKAVAELAKAYSNGEEKHGRGNFEVKFRCAKRLGQESITLNARDWGRKSGHYAGVFRADKLGAIEPLPATIEREFKVIRTRLGSYYLAIPGPIETRGDNQAPVGVGCEAVAIDPGVRTFATTFDLAGNVHEFGAGSIARIQRLCEHYDRLQSRWSDKEVVRSKKRRRMRRAGLRINRRIRNLVDELHRKTAKWLCENYRVILLPTFQTSQMVNKKKKKKKKKQKQQQITDEETTFKALYKEAKRTINSKTARNMLTWSHYRFQMHLKHLVRQYPWCRLVMVTEAYTSKTCSECSHVKQTKFRRYETFECDVCDLVVDRDWNGARNILVRFLTEWARLLPTTKSSCNNNLVIDLTGED